MLDLIGINLYLGTDRLLRPRGGAGVFRKVWCNKEGYKQRVRCVPFRQANSVMPSISFTSLCSFAELQESSISRLSWSFVKEFAVSSYCWSYAQLSVRWHGISQQSYERRDVYSGIELELALSKVSTQVCGFTFGSISLYLISRRIKEILTQKRQYNAKYLSRFNEKKFFHEIKKIWKIYLIFPRFRLYA